MSSVVEVTMLQSVRMKETVYCLFFMYSSKDGAALIDLRGSSCSKASGSRVSNIPPAPLWIN
jgi:hypothetical protein